MLNRPAPSTRRTPCTAADRGLATRGHRASWGIQVTGLLLALGLVACADAQQAAGWAAEGAIDTQQQDIRNGSRTPQVLPLLPGEMLAIGWLASPSNPSANTCSGTLVAADVVVTATHCVPYQVPEEVVFGVGDDPSAPLAIFTVTAIHRHPERDITLLKLSEDARRRLPELRPIPMNNVSLDGPLGEALLGTLVDVAGYGETMDSGRTGRWFAEVRLGEILETTVLVDGEGRQGLCFGDSGGPIIIDRGEGLPVVAGVEHRGDASCVGVDLLMRLDQVQDWIATVLATPSGIACGNVDYRGTCDGDVARWCDNNGQLAQRDCAREAQACGFVDDQIGFYCAPKSGQAADGVAQTPRVVEVAPSSSLKGGCDQSGAPGAGLGGLALLLLAGLRRRR